MTGLEFAKAHVDGHERRAAEGMDCVRCGTAIDSDSDPTAFCAQCVFIAADAMAEALVDLTAAVENWRNSMRSKLRHARCGATEVALSKALGKLLAREAGK